MKEIFAPDNIFNDIMTKVFDIVLLSLLWLLCCVPVITIGTSSAALYTVTLKMTKNREGAIIKSFFKAFKDNFRKTVPMTLIMRVTLSVLIFDLHVLGRMDSEVAGICYGGCITLLAVWGIIFGYAYPLTAKFENTIKNTFINAGKLAVINPLITVGTAILNILPVAWLMISPETFAYIFFIWMIAGAGVVAYVNSYMFNSIFDKITNDED